MILDQTLTIICLLIEATKDNIWSYLWLIGFWIEWRMTNKFLVFGDKSNDLRPHKVLSNQFETNVFDEQDTFIQQVQEIVMKHLSNYQLDVPTLCEELGMARTPLHNKLKALTGMSTTEFVRFVRLSKAKELLLNQDLNVSEVAYMTGFQNHTYFSRKFREVVGMTPKAWREGEH